MSTVTFLRFAAWAALAGAFIPLMAVLNARLGRPLGEPVHPVGALRALGLALLTLGLAMALLAPSPLSARGASV